MAIFRHLYRFVALVTAIATAPLPAADLPPDDPETERASFKVAEGFEVNLFASEKDGVQKPIQIRWDTRGRLWVIGSTTYPQIKPGEVANDKVLILEDTDGDGRADRTTVFAEGLEIPTGLEIAPVGAVGGGAVGGGERRTSNVERRTSNDGKEGAAPSGSGPGSVTSTFDVRRSTFDVFPSPSACYVGEGTKLLLLTDTDGDGKADRREVVLRGFGTGDNHQCINSFRWSPGGELMFSQGLHGHARVETPHGIVALDGAGFFRYRPREGRLDAFYGGQAEPQNPWGFVWTDWGQMLMVAGNNGGIYFPLPEMIRGVQGGRRDQIWENARGRKCSGPDIIGTAHLPPEWQGVMLSGGYINNAVWALKVEDDGAGFKVRDCGERRTSNVERRTPNDGKEEAAPRGKDPAAGSDPSTFDVRRSTFDVLPSPTSPFLSSTDTSFRPVDVKIGPDGAIYICDWYNPIIGHYQASFRHPERDKTHGRIWRVTAKGRPLVKPPAIAGAPLAALFENLESPERWVREMTRLELMGRETDEVVKGLRAWCAGSPGSARVPRAVSGVSPESGRSPGRSPGANGKGIPADPPPPGGTPGAARETRALPPERALVEAMGVFEAFGVFPFNEITTLMVSPEPKARAYAAALVAKLADQPSAEHSEWMLLEMLASDPHPQVRLAAIVAAANMASPMSINAVLTASDQPRDRFIELALRTAVASLEPLWRPRLSDSEGMGLQPKWHERIAELTRPLTSTKPAPPAAAKPAAIPATGKLRATPEFVAALVKEVQAGGDAKHGGEVFRRAELACTSCHSIEDQGGKVGPPLDAVGSGQPLDFIIGAVLEPQREIKESYEGMLITLKDGAHGIGYLVASDAASKTLRDPATGTEARFALADIAKVEPIGSFMPAGLVDGLSREDLRDLLRYLGELGKPK